MNLLYLLSIMLLIISFLILKKNNKKSNIINSIIYSICYIFPYQTVLVYISGLFNLGGSLLYYSFINILISLLLLIPTKNKKKIQKYYFPKKEIFLYLSLILIIFIIVFIRFRGFTILTYMSDDSSIHYRMAMHFKRELSYLTKTNSKDLLSHDFAGSIPASYINGGFFLKIFNINKPYKIFIIYDMLCLILSSILFLSTIIKLYKKDNNYLSLLLISILYSIAFPLNNLLYGFCYLGIGIMIINLIFITIKDIESNLNINKLYNLIILFILNLSLFFSYYLFVPNIYLTIGIYYLILYKDKKISLNTLLKYGIITLIIPFIIGFAHFFLPGIINSKGTPIKAITYYGTIYNNLTPLYLFIFFTGYLGYKLYHKKLNIKDYLSLNIYIISLYCIIFLILYILKKSELYYFYKLFYLFPFFIAVAITKLVYNKKKIVYTFIAIFFFLIVIPIVCGKNNFSTFVSKTNIYSYNSNEIFNSEIRFSKDELSLIENVSKIREICSYNQEIPIITKKHKKYWYYAITNAIPIINHNKVGGHQLDNPSINFYWWENNTEHPCLVYFNEGTKLKYSKEKYKTLYQNSDGLILMKKIKK